MRCCSMKGPSWFFPRRVQQSTPPIPKRNSVLSSLALKVLSPLKHRSFHVDILKGTVFPQSPQVCSNPEQLTSVAFMGQNECEDGLGVAAATTKSYSMWLGCWATYPAFPGSKLLGGSVLRTSLDQLTEERGYSKDDIRFENHD